MLIGTSGKTTRLAAPSGRTSIRAIFRAVSRRLEGKNSHLNRANLLTTARDVSIGRAVGDVATTEL